MHVMANTARDPSRACGGRARAVQLLVALAAIVITTLVPAAISSAQTTPTVPCEGCGPGEPGDGSRVWSYTEFVCLPSRAFIVQFGVGRNVGEAVNFSAGIAPAGSGPVTVAPVASNVQPGQSGTVRLPAPSVNGIVDVRVVGVGATSGRVLLDNTRELECICPDQPTTTQPTTTTPVVPTTVVRTTVPEQVTTTVPGTPTTPPAVATSVPRGTTVPPTLPETGSSNGSVALTGVVLLLLGTSALVVGAFLRRGPAEEA
jgi:LPXTG-motif cell wall-anchored protein